MTTCAWNGEFIAADTLGDQQCLRMYNTKIYQSDTLIMAGAGERAWMLRYWQAIKSMSLQEVLSLGYPDYNSENNHPGMILVGRHNPKTAWFLTGNAWSPITRPYHAIGSGRDFALTAMRLGQPIGRAIEIAAEFDVYTGGQIEVVKIALT